MAKYYLLKLKIFIERLGIDEVKNYSGSSIDVGWEVPAAEVSDQEGVMAARWSYDEARLEQRFR